MYATDYFERLTLNLLRGQSATAPVRVYIGLFLNNPGDEGGGTEAGYSGYARQEIVFSAPQASGAGLSIQNSAVITFAEASNAVGNITHVAVFDSLSGGNMYLYGQLGTPLNVTAGIAPVIRAGTTRWIWSGKLSNVWRTRIMNLLRGQSCSGFTPFLALCNGSPEDGGNEFSGNGYARIGFSFTSPVGEATGVTTVQNAADIVSEEATGNWGQLTHIAIYDAATNGQPFAISELGSSAPIFSGSVVAFRAGKLKFSVN